MKDFQKLKNNEVFVQFLNEIIETAIDHGGDHGGPYCIKEEELFEIMEKFRKWIGLDNYIVCIDRGLLFYAIPFRQEDEK